MKCKFTGTLKAISLRIWNHNFCGGKIAYIRIIQGQNRCKTGLIEDFSSGDTIKWSGPTLERCQGKNFNINVHQLQFKIKTKSKNQFCPRTLRISFNNTYFESDTIGPDIWINKFGTEFYKEMTYTGEVKPDYKHESYFARKKSQTTITQKRINGE